MLVNSPLDFLLHETIISLFFMQGYAFSHCVIYFFIVEFLISGALVYYSPKHVTNTQAVSHCSLSELHISKAIIFSNSFGFLIKSVP